LNILQREMSGSSDVRLGYRSVNSPDWLKIRANFARLESEEFLALCQ
jgi:hypothetical protein